MFIHLTKKLSVTYYKPSTVSGTGDTRVNKTDTNHALIGLYVQWGKQTLNEQSQNELSD